MTCACRPVLAHHLDGPALLRRRPLAQWRPTRRHVLATAVQGPSGGSEGSDADKLRMLPLVGGATGFVACLVNRTTSQVSPVFDSSSSQVTTPKFRGAVNRAVPQTPPVQPSSSIPWLRRLPPSRRGACKRGGIRVVYVTTERGNSSSDPPQSRADVLVIVMSAVLLLTGLSWLSLRPRVVDAVELEGEPVSFVDAGLPRVAREEMEWAWEAASTSAGATSMASGGQARRGMRGPIYSASANRRSRPFRAGGVLRGQVRDAHGAGGAGPQGGEQQAGGDMPQGHGIRASLLLLQSRPLPWVSDRTSAVHGQTPALLSVSALPNQETPVTAVGWS